MKAASWTIAVLSTVLVGLTLWMSAEPAPRTKILIEPQAVWVSQDCPVGQRCI